MSLTLWGRSSSVNVQKVLWALEEYGLDYEHRVAGGKYGGLDSAEFSLLSPVPKVPVLEDGGRGIWESHAILRHLARAQPDHPLSADSSGADSWLDFGTSTLQPPFIGLFWQMVRMPVAERSENAIARHSAGLSAALAVLEGRLEASNWLAGPEMTLAEIGLGTPMYRLRDIAPDLLETRPAMSGWIARLEARPGWQRHVATSYEELRVG